MSGINKAIILGNIGKIETRYTPDGKAIVNLSIATSETWTDKNSGQKQEKTEWHRVIVFGKPAEIISQYCHKGNKIYIEGKIVTRKWQDQQGVDKYTTEIHVDGFGGKFELLTPKEANSGHESRNSQETQNQQQGYQRQNTQNQPAKQDFSQDASQEFIDSDLDDTVPF